MLNFFNQILYQTKYIYLQNLFIRPTCDTKFVQSSQLGAMQVRWKVESCVGKLNGWLRKFNRAQQFNGQRIQLLDGNNLKSGQKEIKAMLNGDMDGNNLKSGQKEIKVMLNKDESLFNFLTSTNLY